MLELAAKNLAKSALTNVSFVKAPITATTLPSGEADCIISNCVINLVPGADKALVFSEIWRLLKPGGRVAVSDILARKELSPELKGHLGLYVGCISGASLVGEYEAWLRGVGFQGEFHSVFVPICMCSGGEVMLTRSRCVDRG